MKTVVQTARLGKKVVDAIEIVGLWITVCQAAKDSIFVILKNSDPLVSAISYNSMHVSLCSQHRVFL